MINHAKSILNFNGNREDGIERISRASCRVVNLASIRPFNEEPKNAKDKIALSMRDLMKKTGRNLLDEKVQVCISVSCCVVYKVNVEIVPYNCKVDLKEGQQ